MFKYRPSFSFQFRELSVSQTSKQQNLRYALSFLFFFNFPFLFPTLLCTCYSPLPLFSYWVFFSPSVFSSSIPHFFSGSDDGCACFEYYLSTGVSWVPVGVVFLQRSETDRREEETREERIRENKRGGERREEKRE